ncbi:MAG: hypothetical protein LBI69_05240 [Puniceicoccales bacterium]|jgi:hypothetical protein|nr:hypothetical protein [Puniceicoccales bacterium]
MLPQSASPFLIAVNPSGLPHSIATIPGTGNETIVNLSPQDVADCFWMFYGIGVHYSYSVMEIGDFSASYEVMCTCQPKERLATPPLFSYETVDETTSVAREFQFFPAEVYENAPGNYAYQLFLGEWSYPNGEIVFSTQIPQNYTAIAESTFSIFGKNISVYLSTSYGGLEGSIGDISLEISTWTIESRNGPIDNISNFESDA